MLGEQVSDAVGEILVRPWYAKPTHQKAFHTLFGRIPEFDGILSEACRGVIPEASIGKTYAAHGLGRSVWCQYGISGSADENGFVENLAARLASAGAYFDRPQGRLAEQIYGTIPAVVRHIKKIKGMVDEKRIFNPGRPVKEV